MSNKLLAVFAILFVLGGAVGFFSAKRVYDVGHHLKVSDSLLMVIAVKDEQFKKWLSKSNVIISGRYDRINQNKKDYEGNIDIDFNSMQLDSILRSIDRNLKEGRLYNDSLKVRPVR